MNLTLNKLPVWLKSMVIATFILEGGTIVWGLLARTNILLTPEIPWSGIVMILILWLLVKYLGGWGPPESTSGNRKLWLRINPISAQTKSWTVISAILLASTLLLFTLLSWQLVSMEFGPLTQIQRIRHLPIWTIAVLILTTSVVAGVIEEIAFRGYLQKPLEIRYGPVPAIVLVATFFTLIHLPGLTITPALIPIFLAGSFGWGVLAYLSNSILPGIVAHAALDAVGFFWIWLDYDNAHILARHNVLDTGFDTLFLWTVGLLLFSITALILSFRIQYKQSNATENTENGVLN